MDKLRSCQAGNNYQQIEDNIIMYKDTEEAILMPKY